MALPKYQKAAAAPKAEPKKRGRKPAASPAAAPAPPAKEAARAASSEPPARKRARTAPGGDAAGRAPGGAAAGKLAAIAAAVKEAHGLPAPVREMLCSALPDCCSVEGPLQPSQEKTLRMLSMAMSDVDAQRSGRLQETTGSSTRANEEFESQKKTHAGAGAALKASSAIVVVKEAALSESRRVLQSCQLALDKLQTEIQRGDALIGGSVMESEQLRLVRAQISEGEAGQDKALAMLREFSFAPDKIENLSQLGEDLATRMETLSQRVSKVAAARVTLVAEGKAAQAALDSATKKQQACVEALARAQSEKHERATALKAAARSLKQLKVLVAQTVQDRQTAEKQLAEFRKRPLAAFKGLAKEIEQRHGLRIFDGSKTSIEVAACASLVPELEPVVAGTQEDSIPTAAACSSRVPDAEPVLAELQDDKSAQPTEPVQKGTPVIDRKQRQAVVRRRSAALPTGFFTRLSLMARRSSVAAPRRSVAGTGDARLGTGGSDSEGEDRVEAGIAHRGDGDAAQVEERKNGTHTFDGALVVPTPNRISISAAPQ